MIRAALLPPLAFLVLSSPPPEAALGQILARLEPLRATFDAPDTNGMRLATPALMPVKQAVRDWIEARQVRFDENGDAHALQAELNAAIRTAGLTCDSKTPSPCDRPSRDWNAIGYLTDISVTRPTWTTLVITAGVGIRCGRDESAYAYRWEDGGWRRIWQEEQPIAPGYRPRRIESVEISDDQESQTILSLGTVDWCQSNWRSVIYSLWKVRGHEAPRRLLDVVQTNAFLGSHTIPVRGGVSKDSALVEFTAGSLDSDVFSYQSVWRYAIRGDTATRVAPIALGPRSFVEQWITSDWRDSSRWNEDGAALAAWHARAHRPHTLGRFAESARCSEADAWQIGFTPDGGKPVWYRVRWTPPYAFRMIAVADHPDPGCATPDPEADAYRTLFSGGDWIE